MPQVKPEVEAFARIKVIGVGGSGKNAVNHMVNNKVKGVDFVAVNTDAQELHHSLAKKKIHIGKNLTRGLGAGMNPELGKKAIEENKEEIQEAVKGSDMVFIPCGMGGGTASGAAPTVAKISKELGALTVGVVTKPFFFEGQERMRIAEQAIEEMRKSVDAIIIIPNDRLLGIIDRETTARNAFSICDEVLKQAVEGISDLITTPGMINIDFADIRAVMDNAGSALMGVGHASGENRTEQAARNAINSPLLELSIDGAQGVLFSIAGGDDLTMFEIQDAAKIITESVDPNAKIIFGTVQSDKLKKGEIKITVIASGFPEQAIKKATLNSQGVKKDDIETQTEPSGEANTQNSTNSNAGAKNTKSSEGRIHNSFTGNEEGRGVKFNRGTSTNTQSNDASQNDSAKKSDDEDDDWGAIPAFLRRSRLK